MQYKFSRHVRFKRSKLDVDLVVATSQDTTLPAEPEASQLPAVLADHGAEIVPEMVKPASDEPAPAAEEVCSGQVAPAVADGVPQIVPDPAPEEARVSTLVSQAALDKAAPEIAEALPEESGVGGLTSAAVAGSASQNMQEALPTGTRGINGKDILHDVVSRHLPQPDGVPEEANIVSQVSPTEADGHATEEAGSGGPILAAVAEGATQPAHHLDSTSQLRAGEATHNESAGDPRTDTLALEKEVSIGQRPALHHLGAADTNRVSQLVREAGAPGQSARNNVGREGLGAGRILAEEDPRQLMEEVVDAANEAVETAVQEAARAATTGLQRAEPEQDPIRENPTQTVQIAAQIQEANPLPEVPSSLALETANGTAGAGPLRDIDPQNAKPQEGALIICGTEAVCASLVLHFPCIEFDIIHLTSTL